MTKLIIFYIAFGLICKFTFGQNNVCFSQGPFNPINSSTPFSFCSPDLNNDGFKDIVVGSVGGIQIFLTTGSNSLQATPFTLTNSGFNYFVLDKDFNGDGNADLASCAFNDNHVNIWLGTGTGTFAPLTQFLVTSSPNSMTCTDFNNDGFFDIASADNNSGFITVLINNGAGNFSSGGGFQVGANPQYLVSDNFNNDNYLDIAVSNGTVLTILQGNSNGIFTIASTNTVAFSSALSNNYSFVVKDLNNDGNADIVGLMQSTQSLGVLFGNSNFSFQPLITNTLNFYPQAIAVSDIDLNGYDDIILTNTSYSLSFLFNGSGGIGSPVNYSLTTNNVFQAPLYVSCPDMNNDGTPDVFVGFDNGEPSQVLVNCNTITYIEPSFKEKNEVSIYPNPVVDYFDVEAILNEQYKLTIYNSRGEKVFYKDLSFTGAPIRVDANKLNSGIYVVTLINTQGEKQCKKLLVSK